MAKITALSFIVPVRDLDRAVAFYHAAFGLEEVFRGEQIVFVGLPGTDSALGCSSILRTQAAARRRSASTSIMPCPAGQAVRDVEAAGGKVLEQGEHAPDVPFARIADVDGNELWI